ncbi:MAG TPA: arylamine N-acetyltransferase [Roseiflexaceae bacterium]|nr:arylamine N-acetyltransferase [Roseiflexaceae bacterium]
MIDLHAYFDRIDYHGVVEPTGAVLCALHRAHLLAVPFENLSIGWGQPIVLEPNALFDKIVHQRRGGFCYELNGVFAELLRAIGFEVTLPSAGVARADGGFGPDFDHLALLIQEPKAPQAWLVDVGFGDSFREPLRFVEGQEHHEGERAYRVVRTGEHHVLEQRDGDGEWQSQYRFTLQPRQFAEFADMCHFHQTSPESSFTRRRVCTRATPEGRITLSDMRLITTRGGERTEELLPDERAVERALHDYFGIELPDFGVSSQ